jgi:glycosyltransferase involved in cell wall biosynthesis
MATAVSACFVRTGRVGGAEHALYNLLDGLRTVTTADPWSVVTAEPLAMGFDLAPLIARPTHLAGVRNRVAIESLVLPAMRDVDRWLLPNYYTPAGLRGRIVTIIHDAQYAHYPENFSFAKRHWLSVAHRHTMRRADVVVAISQFVADDLLRLHGQRFAAKVEVIPNAVSFDRLEGGLLPAAVPVDREIVLCVAAGYRHKNLPTLVRAFADLRRQRDGVHLVLVGQSPDQLIGARTGDDVDSLVHELDLDNHITSLAYVSDPELGALYRAAAVLAMPSLLEGFGLPVVEALGMGVPVVTTRAGSLPEVSLGLARYVDDSMSPVEMASALADTLKQGTPGRPSAGDIRRVRAHYEPATVAKLICAAVTG